MTHLHLDKDNNFDADWIKERDLVSSGLPDSEYCKKMGIEVPITVQYLLDHGVKQPSRPGSEFFAIPNR